MATTSRQQLHRATTDLGPRGNANANAQLTTGSAQPSAEENWELRHGWEDQYNSEEYLSILSSVRPQRSMSSGHAKLGSLQSFYMYYTDKRHESGGRPKNEDHARPAQEWRMRDRLKTVSAGLMLCLNLGVDPPDVMKTNPTANLECWVDPTAPNSANTKTMELIGKALQTQYETLSIRTRYKQYLDPSVEETRRCCQTLRRNARDERVLFHYNGHGVPSPTPSGEVWFFNRNYTQYIPVSLYDLQMWLAGPCIYVLDVSHAGNVLLNFDRFVTKHEEENGEARARDPNAQIQTYGDNIILASCGAKDTLPTNPDLPADLFTSCLTTPVQISLRCFILDNQLPTDITVKDIERVPGRLQERRTPLGELNWIFTAITDTIAWNVLPRALFRKLFRQDLMVAALFRNYLLADRQMRANNCTPRTQPALPETHNHPLWNAWDYAIEMVLTQLPALLASDDGGPHYEYEHSNFFSEQLTAFEVYLSQGSPEQTAPDQLPIVLQVLLSQVHRLRALILLSRFLDLGPWAVNLALSIGIFPYVLKLLQSAAQELKPVMIFIWARILSVDQSCQTDLLKDNGYTYFLTVLNMHAQIPVGNASEHRAMSAFIIAMFCKDFHQGKVVSESPELFTSCITYLQDADNPLLRQWSCLCISMLWQDYPDAKWTGIRALAHQRLCEMALDPVPEVRAAAIHALNNFLGIPDLTEQVAQIEQSIASTIMTITSDGNSMVRRELLVFFSTFVKRYENKFLVSSYEELINERDRLLRPPFDAATGRVSNLNNTNQVSAYSVFASIWRHLLIMSVDPHPEVAQNAMVITDYVHEKLLTSPLASRTKSIMDEILRLSRKPAISRQPSSSRLSEHAQSPGPTLGPVQRSESYLSLSLKRTASIAAAFKHLTIGGPASTPNPHSSEPGSSENNAPQEPSRLGGPLRSRAPAEWSRPPNEHDQTIQSIQYQQAKAPMTRGFEPRNGADIPTLPLKSGFFDWSIEVFAKTFHGS